MAEAAMEEAARAVAEMAAVAGEVGEVGGKGVGEGWVEA